MRGRVGLRSDSRTPPEQDPQKSTPGADASATPGVYRAALSGGRALELRFGEGQERLEIRGPAGLEISLQFTDKGPVLRIEGAALELAAAGPIKVSCDSLELDSKKGTTLKSGGDIAIESDKEVKITSTEDTTVKGKIIRLN